MSSSHARTYRRLGYLALMHAGVLVGLLAIWLRLQSEDEFWLQRLWVGLVTLWFLWPIVLALHPGRSALRLGVFALLSVVLLWPSLSWYDMIAAEALGLPKDAHMNPIEAWMFFSAYRTGRAEAQKDVAAGNLAIEEFGFGAGSGGQILRERYQIELRPIAQCLVDQRILGHAAGYNSVSEPEIHRRFGRERITAARDEGVKLAMEESAREHQFSEDLARDLSSLPPDGRIMAESIYLYVDEKRLNDRATAEEFAPLLHAIEKYLLEQVPKDAPSCKFCVLAKSTPSSSPSFEISCQSGPMPQPEWESIYKNLQTIAVPGVSGGSLSASFHFVIH